LIWTLQNVLVENNKWFELYLRVIKMIEIPKIDKIVNIVKKIVKIIY
jgi:hypothetical protein